MSTSCGSWLLVLLAGVALTSCGGGDDCPSCPPPVTPGELVFRLSGAAPDDAAVVLVLRGPATPSTIKPIGEVVLFTRTGAGATKIAAFGTMANGLVLRVAVPDIHVADQYTVTVQEVATTANTVRDEVGSYQVRLEP